MFGSLDTLKIATNSIVIKGRSKKWEYKNFLEREFSGEYEPMTLEGSMFEISALIFLEGICSELFHSKGV